MDNLANAQELTAAEEADEKAQEEVSECSSLLGSPVLAFCFAPYTIAYFGARNLSDCFIEIFSS